MTIHCPFITVIAPVSIIEEKLAGGLEEFRSLGGMNTFCTDGHLASISFMGPHDSRPFAQALEEKGFTIWGGTEGVDLHFVDIAVVEVMGGPTLPCEWLETEFIETIWVARLKGTPAGEITFMQSMSPDEIERYKSGIASQRQSRIAAFNALPNFVQEMSDHQRRQYYVNEDIKRRIEKSRKGAWAWIIGGVTISAVTFAAALSGGGHFFIAWGAPLYGIIKLGKCKELEQRYNRGEFLVPE